MKDDRPMYECDDCGNLHYANARLCDTCYEAETKREDEPTENMEAE